MNGVYDQRSYARVRLDTTPGVVSGMRPTVSCLVKAMGCVVMRCVYFNSMAKFLKTNSSVDDETFCAAWKKN
jgi:hypothetical protein